MHASFVISVGWKTIIWKKCNLEYSYFVVNQGMKGKENYKIVARNPPVRN